MFLNKIDLPYCLVVLFVVCPRLRPLPGPFTRRRKHAASLPKANEHDELRSCKSQGLKLTF